MEPEEPAPVVPIPAADFDELRGRRAIMGVPGIGFRGDLRADDAVVQGGQTFVPVLPEHDYYRAETDQIEVFALLVPIDRVWVEDVRPAPTSRAFSLDAPPTRAPCPALRQCGLSGRRLIQAVADGFRRDVRAVSEAYLSSTGASCVRVCMESEWYRWAHSGKAPVSSEISLQALWVE